MEMKCGMCGWVRKPQGIFHVCTNPDCVENPASKAAAADRRMTMEAWERDNADETECDACDCADPTALAGLADECACDCHAK